MTFCPYRKNGVGQSVVSDENDSHLQCVLTNQSKDLVASTNQVFPRLSPRFLQVALIGIREFSRTFFAKCFRFEQL